jgi:ABC-type nitrate/sulfonate/bicarbonate transport system permease component
MNARLARLLPTAGGSASAVLGFVILLAIWWGAAAIFHVRAVILPAPSAVWHALAEIAADGSLGRDVLTSLVELLWGLLIGASAGVVSGVAIARSRGLRAFLDPIVETFRFVVPFSLVPLVVVWFGVSITGKIFVVAYACYFVVTINTAAAIADVDPLVLKAASMLGCSGWRLLLQVVLPAALPRILTGLQVALAYAWVSVIAAEYVGSTAGLGYLIINAQSGLETARVMAGMVVIGALGLIFSQLVALVRRVAVPYADNHAW